MVNKKKEILIVDDDKEDTKMMEQILKKEGYNVFLANDGDFALKKIKKNDFDLILIDILMPKLTGYDLSGLLKKTLTTKTKIAYVSIVLKKNVDMSHVDGFIQKPFSNISFLKNIKKLLK